MVSTDGLRLSLHKAGTSGRRSHLFRLELGLASRVNKDSFLRTSDFAWEAQGKGCRKLHEKPCRKQRLQSGQPPPGPFQPIWL